MKVTIYQDKKTQTSFYYLGDQKLDVLYPRLTLITTVAGFNLLVYKINDTNTIRLQTWKSWKAENMPSEGQLKRKLREINNAKLKDQNDSIQ